MLTLTLWAMDNTCPEMVGLFGDGVAAALEALFASKPELVGRREGFTEGDGVGVLRGGRFAVREGTR